MRRLILVTLLSVMCTCLIAQNIKDTIVTRPQENIYVNFLGDASEISLGYERLLFINENSFLVFTLGIGYDEEFSFCMFGPCSSPPDKYITIPHHITYNIGKGRHFLELGVGGTITNGYSTYSIIGYRLHPLKSDKMNFRIYGSIPFNDLQGVFFMPFGLSLGVSF